MWLSFSGIWRGECLQCYACVLIPTSLYYKFKVLLFFCLLRFPFRKYFGFQTQLKACWVKLKTVLWHPALVKDEVCSFPTVPCFAPRRMLRISLACSWLWLYQVARQHTLLMRRRGGSSRAAAVSQWILLSQSEYRIGVFPAQESPLSLSFCLYLTFPLTPSSWLSVFIELFYKGRTQH